MHVLVGLTNLPQILVTWSIYFGAGVLFLAAAFWAKRSSFPTREFLAERFPFNLRSSRSAQLDVKVYLIGKLTDVLWAAPGNFFSAVLPLAVLGVLREVVPAPQQGVGPVVLTVIGVALFLTIELGDFVVHYGEHKIPALWELHKIHHSADSLNPLTSKRGHPFCLVLEGVVRAFFFCVPAGVAMHFGGLSLLEVFAARTLVLKTCNILTLEPLRHSPFPVGFGRLDRLVISPHMHQVHHSSLQPHWDKNFGNNLSLYDWLFRTGYKPVKDEPVEFGLYGYGPAELAAYHTLQGTYVTPLGKAWRKIVPARDGARTPVADPAEDGVIPA